MLSSRQQTSNGDLKAVVAVYWKKRQCNIVIDTAYDRRSIQRILDTAKRTIRGMIHRERRHIRQPH